MGAVSLRFPVVVRAEDPSVAGERTRFRLRPLFAEGPEGTAPRFEEARQRLERRVLKQFSLRSSLTRSDLDELLLFCFNPELETRRMELSFHSGARDINGPFTVVWFDLRGERYVVLPGFDCHMFIARKERSNRYPMEKEVTRVIQHLLRRERAEAGSELLDPAVHYAPKREFVTEVDAQVHVKTSTFPFEGRQSSIFSFLFDFRGFSGSAELRRVARNLNESFPVDLMRAIGRETLVQRVQEALFGGENAAVVVVGDSGVGKTAILHEAIARHLEAASDQPQGELQQVWELEPARVIAGMSEVGMWQRRFEAILESLHRRLRKDHGIEKEDALFVNNPVALLRIGKSSQNDFSLCDVLIPHLESRRFSFFAEATPTEWARIQEMNRSFADLLEVIRVPELAPAEAWQVVARKRAGLEVERAVRIEDSALLRLRDLSKPQPRHRPMPGRIVDLLERLSSRHAGDIVRPEEVDAVFLEQSGLREEVADPDRTLTPLSVQEFVRQRLVGQDEANRCLVDTVCTIKTHLADPERPFGAYLFVGPTGVGKTEAAKVLAEYLFGESERLVRFDMNEYVDEAALSRLIGDLHRPEGQLTGAVRYRPYCVLLLDEIEKAHPDVHDALLQLLDEGRLTDSLGRTADFTRTVVIMTSNVGAEKARSTAGFGSGPEERTAIYRSAVKDFFRPEFVNRIDRIVAFKPLGPQEAQAIARLQIDRLLHRDGFLRRATVLSVTDEVLGRIAQEGYDPDLGGRALKRAVEKNLAVLAAGQLAVVPPEHPVILEIRMRSGNPYLRVIPLKLLPEGTHSFPMDPPSREEDVPAFYGRLLEAAEELRARSTEFSGLSGRGTGVGTENKVPDVELEALLFRDRLNEVVRRLEDMVDDARRPPRKFVTPFRVRKISESVNWGGSGPKRWADKLFAEMEVREYIQGLYEGANRAFAKADTETVELFMDVAALRAVQPTGRNENENASSLGGVCLHLRSLLKGQGLERLSFLWEGYGAVLSRLDPASGRFQKESTSASGDEIYLTASGTGLFEFFRPEAGIHLFMETFGGMLPIQVRVLGSLPGVSSAEVVSLDQAARRTWEDGFEEGRLGEEDDPHRVGPVLRLYVPPGEGEVGNITDLRTGLTDEYHSDGRGWFIWMYAGLPEGDYLTVDL